MPGSLKEQLTIGGRLVMPVGLDEWSQTLRKLTRMSETAFEAEDLDSVIFLPLISE